MLECSVEGNLYMNALRKKLFLEPIPIPYHNFFFEKKKLLAFLKRYFFVKKVIYFSDYFYLTRIVSQILNKKLFVKFNPHMKLISKLRLFNNQIGPQFLLILKKK